MNKLQFIKAIAARTGSTQKHVNEIICAAFDIIQNSVTQGDSVNIAGFGSFSSYVTTEREGINPKTKQTITIPAKSVPKFKAGKTFKELVAKTIG